MKALRLKIHQNIGHYKIEETISNKLTYPLPQPSTIIGALHNICNYESYQPISVSIAGNFDYKSTVLKKENIFLDSLNDDRDFLVYIENPNILSNNYIKVAQKSLNGASFYKEKDIYIYNQTLLDKYKNLKDDINNISERIKNIKKEKNIDSNILEDLKIQKKIKKEELCHFKSLTKAITYYELLNNVDLVIHLLADEKILDDIYTNIHKLNALGRSEDFIDIIECKYVHLSEDDKIKEPRKLHQYISKEAIDQNIVRYNSFSKRIANKKIKGTLYYISTNYKKIDNKRMFNKEKVLLLNDITISKSTTDYNKNNKSKLYIDEDNYLVNLIN